MRKPEHINAMLKTPTLKSYLNEISNQTIFKTRKEIKEQDRKKTLISCFVMIRDSSSKSEGSDLENAFKLFEDVNDETEDIHGKGIINRLYVFLGHEYFPQGKASELRKNLIEVKTRYFPESAHTLPNVTEGTY